MTEFYFISFCLLDYSQTCRPTYDGAFSLFLECVNYKWGLDCSQTCRSVCGGACDKGTGECLDCTVGKYGDPNCDKGMMYCHVKPHSHEHSLPSSLVKPHSHVHV